MSAGQSGMVIRKRGGGMEVCVCGSTVEGISCSQDHDPSRCSDDCIHLSIPSRLAVDLLIVVTMEYNGWDNDNARSTMHDSLTWTMKHASIVRHDDPSLLSLPSPDLLCMHPYPSGRQSTPDASDAVYAAHSSETRSIHRIAQSQIPMFVPSSHPHLSVDHYNMF